MAAYQNSFHKPGRPEYGPEYYVTDAEPVAYRDHLIFQRLRECFDVVRDGVCIGQYAGLNGAKRYIDARLEAGR